jgi:hypothetical protein
MTAATSEYAMLDSMFAMDPVFPGLGNLDDLNQQFIPNWGTDPTTTTTSTNGNGDTNHNHTQNISSQSHPVHPTFLSNQPPQQQQQQQQPDLLSTGFDAPTPWSTWLQNTLQGQGQGQTQVPVDEGLLAGNKKTMSSSEVYKKVVKP